MMTIPAQMDRLTHEIIASYEARVASVEQIIDAAHDILDIFRRQGEAVRAELRESLAKAASLRRRDFDTLMRGVLARQEEQEEAVKRTIRVYLQEQRVRAASLREIMAGRSALQAESLTDVLTTTHAHWAAREREVRSLLADFQHEQEELARALKELLARPETAGVKALKATLRSLQIRSSTFVTRLRDASARGAAPEESGEEDQGGPEKQRARSETAPLAFAMAALGELHD